MDKAEEVDDVVIVNERLNLECRVELHDGHYHLTFVDQITKASWQDDRARYLNLSRAIEAAQRGVFLSADEIKELNEKAMAHG